MRYKYIIIASTLLISSCQSGQTVEQTLSPSATPPSVQSQNLTGVAQIVSGNRFRNGAEIVTFAQDGTYRYSKNGFSTYTRWSAEGDSLCLHFERKRCSKLKHKGGERYGWSFRGRSEFSYQKLAGETVTGVGPIGPNDTILPLADAQAYLRSKVHQLPNRAKISMTNTNRVKFVGRGRSNAATLSPQGNKLCGSFRIGSSTCISVVINNERHFVVSERQSGRRTNKYMVLN